MRNRPGPYQANSTLESSQFGIQPLQTVTIPLDGIDRTVGTLMPTIEGEYLYIERTDFPFLLSLIGQETQENRMMVARAGLEIVAPFKGICVAHPLLTAQINSDAPYSAKIHFGKAPDVYLSNHYPLPYSQHFPSLAVTTSTTSVYMADVYVPPGTRHCKELTLWFAGSAPTQAEWFLNSLTAGNTYAMVAPQLTVLAGAFTAINNPQGIFDVSIPLTGFLKFTSIDIPLPAQCKTIAVQIAATATLGAFVSCKALFA